jgi:hypothetical protein
VDSHDWWSCDLAESKKSSEGKLVVRGQFPGEVFQFDLSWIGPDGYKGIFKSEGEDSCVKFSIETFSKPVCYGYISVFSGIEGLIHPSSDVAR